MRLNDLLKSRLFPIRAPLTFSLSRLYRGLCALERRGQHQQSKYCCWTIIIALSHLWAVLPGSMPARGWDTISLKRLQFISSLCISLGDIKWQHSDSHLISFSEKLSPLWWIISSSAHCWMVLETEQQAFPSQMHCVLILTDLRRWINTSNITFPVCRKDDYMERSPISICCTLILTNAHTAFVSSIILLCSNTVNDIGLYISSSCSWNWPVAKPVP